MTIFNCKKYYKFIVLVQARNKSEKVRSNRYSLKFEEKNSASGSYFCYLKFFEEYINGSQLASADY
jgi:hypothetical protein